MSPSNWQTQLPSLRDRNKYAFNNSLFCDVKFTVQDANGAKVIVPANKYVLAISSPVFEAMFYGELVDVGKSDIELTDCTKEGLHDLLCYVYSDEVNLTSRNVMELLHLAEKYTMPFLMEKCKKHLKESVGPEEVMSVLPEVKKIGDKQLQQHFLSIVDRETHRVVLSDPFLNAPRETLCDILDRDSLNIKEVDLFCAVDRWAEKRLKEKGLENHGKSKRSILGEDLIRKIRFPLIELTDFTSIVVPCEMLKRNELTEVFQTIHGISLSSKVFSSKQRRLSARSGSLVIPRLRFDDISLFLMDYDGISKDAISFSVNKTLFLVGVRMFGGQASTYRLKLQVHKQDQMISQLSSTFTSGKEQIDNSYFGFTANLDEPVRLEPNMVYTVEAMISGPRSLAGSHGEATVALEDVVVTYMNSPISDRTTIRKGQFPTFIFQNI